MLKTLISMDQDMLQLLSAIYTNAFAVDSS